MIPAREGNRRSGEYINKINSRIDELCFHEQTTLIPRIRQKCSLNIGLMIIMLLACLVSEFGCSVMKVDELK